MDEVYVVLVNEIWEDEPREDIYVYEKLADAKSFTQRLIKQARKDYIENFSDDYEEEGNAEDMGYVIYKKYAFNRYRTAITIYQRYIN